MLNSVRPNGSRDSRFHHSKIVAPGVSLDLATFARKKKRGGQRPPPILTNLATVLWHERQGSTVFRVNDADQRVRDLAMHESGWMYAVE